MMLLLLFSVLLGLSNARPNVLGEVPRPNFFMGIDSYIVGGSNAAPGEFPWQLSLERLSDSIWFHSCGASLLSSRYGLSAAHCVDGATSGILRVIAGLHDRTNPTGAQVANVGSYRTHEAYNNGAATNANDIAILTFAIDINLGGNVDAALLPRNDNDDFVGLICQISGWGYTDASSTVPDILQKANIEVISSSECQVLMTGMAGIVVWDNHICVYDRANNAGACNGDNGGPLNCEDLLVDLRVVGVASWGISGALGNCLQTYPTVYTRTSAYLDWIETNTP